MIPCASSRRSSSAARTSDSSAATSPSSVAAGGARRPLARDREIDREGQQTLLRPVMEITFKPPAFGIRGRDDLRCASSVVRQACLALGVQSLVLEREARRVHRVGDAFRVVMPGRPGGPAPRPGAPPRRTWVVLRVASAGTTLGDASRIDESPVVEWVQDLERRVTELSTERRRELAGRGSGGQFERETCHSLAGLTPTQPTGSLARSDCHQCESLPPTKGRCRPDRSRPGRAGSSTRQQGRPRPGRRPPAPAHRRAATLDG